MGGTEYMFASEADATEFERLNVQSLIYDWPSTGRLNALGLGAGATCLEVGPGAGSIARWMAGEVGPTGKVVTIDNSDRFFPALVHPQIDVRLDDIRSCPLEP